MDPVQTESSSLQGSAAIVTGAGSILGRAFAHGLARAGVRVAVLGRTRAVLEATAVGIAEAGGTCLAIPADGSHPPSVDRALDRVRRALGPTDTRVNNAGVLGPVGPDWEVDDQGWWHTLEVNLRGPRLMTQAVLPDMLERGRGRIINNISSAAYNLESHYTAYGASNAALSYWSSSLARALGPRGVRVFAYAPGFVRTAMTLHLAEDPDARGWIGDGVRRALAEGRDLPTDRAARTLVEIAGGGLDFLSGRHIDARDDLERLRLHQGEIRDRDLYLLRRRELEH